MIILGIDPGTARTGYGVILKEGSRLQLKDYGCIKTTINQPLRQRLQKIYQEVLGLISQYKPEVVVVEQLFINANVPTALAVGQAQGVVLLAAAHSTVETVYYTPLQVKQAVVGYGRAQKEQVQYMVRAILSLPELPYPDDAADALAVAICHAHSEQLQGYARNV